MNLQDDEVIDNDTTNISDDDDAPTGADRGDDFNPAAEEVADEVPAKPEGEDEAAAQAAGRMIPKARFDEVNNQRKTVEQENARLLAELEALRRGEIKETAQEAPAATAETAEVATTLADMEDQYTDALMDGDKDKARAIRMEINAIVSADAQARALREIDSRNQAATDEQLIDSAATSVIGKYPALNDLEEGANEAAIAELVELRDYYIHAKKMHPADAIIAAADKVASMFGFAEGAQAQGVDTRTRAAIERGAAVSNAQPNTSAVGVGTRADAGKINIHTMSEEQFDALPEAEKRRMRGD